MFTLAEPAGYPAANDRVLAEADASGGRLRPLCRCNPAARGAVAELRRCVDAGAVGVKLHPRSEGFVLSDPVAVELVAVAHERRLPVMIHAGRGIPSLGRDAIALARRFPDARLILAHAGISDLGWIWREAADIHNLFFDTAWWNVVDLLALLALVPAGRLLYGSDMPYGSAVFCGLAMLRTGLAVGLSPAALASIAGGQLDRLLSGKQPLDLGPAPGPVERAPSPAAQRAVQHLGAALSRSFARTDPTEPLALARLACDVPLDDGAHAALLHVARLIAIAEQGYEQTPDRPPAVELPALGAAVVAATPDVPLPSP